jgi:transposase
MDELFIGIDVSKAQLDVHVCPVGDRFAVARNADGLDELIGRLRPLGARLIAVEATGGFETTTAAALAGAGLPVVVVNPAQVRSFALSLGQRAKTDRIDAEIIARFAEAIRPELRPLPDAETQMLADLMTRRRQIVTMIVAEKNREKRAASTRMRRSHARLIKELEKALSAHDEDIDEMMRGSPAWREKEDLLASVIGVGPISARTMIAELPELGTLDRRQVASLAGLAPFTRQSGQWQGKSMIAGGRAPVRSALFMATVVAVRHNPTLKAHYQQLIARGKRWKVAIIACARKLLVILNAILRDKKPWQSA